jgi:penicillin-binding protein 2
MRPTLVREILDSEGNIVKPFEPDLKWDVTVDPKIHVYDENSIQTGELKIIEPWVVQMAKQGMHMVVTDGTAKRPFEGMEVQTAGKTGTAEYCDNVAQAQNRCQPGNWPTHSWYFGYAPYDNPEIAVVAFVYNGGEGASVAAPIVRTVMESYFNLKAIDLETGGPQAAP